MLLCPGAQMTWADDLKKLTDKGSQNLAELCKSIKVEIFSGVVSDTRVDTGRLRGNWQIQENSPATGEIERLDKSGSIINKEIDQKSTADGLTYFVNNLPYAKLYEEKDAMVARNIVRVKSNVSDMARKVKG